MRKSARIFVIICVCLALIACAAAPAYASGTAEYQTYTDYFDSESATLHQSVSAFLRIRYSDYSLTRTISVKVVNDNIVCVTSGQIVDFVTTTVNDFVEEHGVELSDCSIMVNVNIESLYSAHAQGSAFPFAAYKYNLTAVGTNLEFHPLLVKNSVSGYGQTSSLSYTISFPSPLSGSVSGIAEYTPENTFYLTKSVDQSGPENYFYLNSCTVSMDQNFVQFGNAEEICDLFRNNDQSDVMLCGWNFALYNVYQYLMPPPETTAPPPWNEVSEPDITSPTVPPEDEFYQDKTKDIGDKVNHIFNGVPFAKYSQAAIALSKYFKKLFSDIPFIGDLMSVFVAFAAFNILLGGFVVGVRAFATDERSRQRQQDNIKARQEAARQRRVDEFMRDDPPSPEEWYNK